MLGDFPTKMIDKGIDIDEKLIVALWETTMPKLFIILHLIYIDNFITL